ncbi:MAG: hypothetical protein K6D96_03120 [Acetatifactor sp.]|nr:hypothetical protein [Acetatifactor sp.]
MGEKNEYYYKNYQMIADSCLMTLSKEHGLIYGEVDGFDMVLYPKKKSTPYALTVVLGAVKAGDADIAKEIKNTYKFVNEVKFKDNHLEIELKELKEEALSSFNNILKAFAALLKSKGFEPACENCGKSIRTMEYLQGEGSFQILCDECADEAKRKFAGKAEENSHKRERVILGLIGAIIGAAIGSALIILIGRAGYVTTFTGFVLGIATVLLYRKFAGKMSIISVIVCLIVMGAAVYLSNRAVWAYAILNNAGAKEYGMTFLDCFMWIPDLIKEKYIDSSDYTSSLVKYILFTAVGGVGMLASEFRSYKLENRFVPIRK